jgi:hypothetical protein
MEKSFLSFLPSFLLCLALTTGAGSALAFKDKSLAPGGERNLDTGEPAAELIDNTLKYHSYIIPYLPKGTRQLEGDLSDSGLCTPEGVVVKGNVRSSNSCGVYTSSAGLFKIQRYQKRDVDYISQIWKQKKVNGETHWVPWVRFDSGGNPISTSHEAAQFASRSQPGKNDEPPQYAREAPPPVQGIPNIQPDLGTLWNGLMNRVR